MYHFDIKISIFLLFDCPDLGTQMLLIFSLKEYIILFILYLFKLGKNEFFDFLSN